MQCLKSYKINYVSMKCNLGEMLGSTVYFTHSVFRPECWTKSVVLGRAARHRQGGTFLRQSE